MSCNKDAATIDSLAKHNRTVVGGEYVYRLDKEYRLTHRGIFTYVGIVLYSDEATVRDASGKSVDHFDRGEPRTIYLRLHPRNGNWLVEGIDN